MDLPAPRFRDVGVPRADQAQLCLGRRVDVRFNGLRLLDRKEPCHLMEAELVFVGDAGKLRRGIGSAGIVDDKMGGLHHPAKLLSDI